MFRELVVTSETRPNMMPILGDATRPEEYSMFTDRVDIVYQDVAQKMQAKILCDNMDAFNAEFGMMAVKARSEDVTASPDSIFKDAERALREMGFSILDDEPLEPFEKAHAMIAVKRD
jgi:fibrillarin-like pre-rRNA processing protein